MAQRFSDKQKKFIDSYVACLNATQAAEEAGYKFSNRNSLAQTGKENLRKPTIRAEINRLLKENTIDPEELLGRISDQATGSMADFLDVVEFDEGEVIRLSLAKAQELNKLHLIKKYKETETKRKDKDGNEYSTLRREVELYDAQAAQDRLMRFYSMYKDKIQVITWRDKIVDALRKGEIDKGKVVERLGDKLATQLFLEAGVNAS